MTTAEMIEERHQEQARFALLRRIGAVTEQLDDVVAKLRCYRGSQALEQARVPFRAALDLLIELDEEYLDCGGGS